MSYYSDLNLDFETQNDGDLKLDTNEDAVINSIKNIMRTLQGSRRMLPTFALNIYYLLHQPMDDITAQAIGNIILEVVQVWDNRVIIKNLNIYPYYDFEQYNITLSVRIKGMKEPVKIEEILKKL